LSGRIATRKSETIKGTPNDLKVGLPIQGAAGAGALVRGSCPRLRLVEAGGL
jgi:hypothetical protein